MAHTLTVAVFYYTQTGQALAIARSLCAPLEAAGCRVVTREIRPVTAYPFPWSSEAFFQVFPESRLGIACAIEPVDLSGAVAEADLVIGAVLVPGARTPSLVTRATVETMRPGSVLVDIAIDQGGCFEDSRPTTHSEPTFEVDGKIFYCVANMPGAVPNTSTYALTNATLPYALALADEGWRGAIAARPDLARGLSTHAGTLYTAGVGEALDIPTADVVDLLS